MAIANMTAPSKSYDSSPYIEKVFGGIPSIRKDRMVTDTFMPFNKGSSGLLFRPPIMLSGKCPTAIMKIVKQQQKTT